MRTLGTFACLLLSVVVFAQDKQTPPTAAARSQTSPSPSIPAIPLAAASTTSVASEAGGAFIVPSKCDEDGNLYIRKYSSDRPLLGPVVKIDPAGKRTAFFDPAAFTKLGLDRADAFSPASDGGIYQIAQKGIVKPQIYVLHFSADGSPSTPVRLDADLEVYTFAAFAGGNFLVSGVQRDATNAKDPGRTSTATFSADGRLLQQLSFPSKSEKGQAGTAGEKKEAVPALDLSEAEAGTDGNLYVMRRSSPAVVFVISPDGTILRTFKVAAPQTGAMPSTFHLSGNRMAVSYSNDHDQNQTLIAVDAQSGRRIATFSYSNPERTGPAFACYSANDSVFTFLTLGEANALEVTRAEPR